MWNTSLPKNNNYQPGPVTSHLTSGNVTCVYGHAWSPTLTIDTVSKSTRIKPSYCNHIDQENLFVGNKAAHIYYGNRENTTKVTFFKPI